MKASSSDGYPQTTIEDLDTRSGRGVDPRSLTSLALGDWVEAGYSLLISGPTGAGKSWLACALAQYACRRGHAALYLRVPRLGKELRVLHGNGGFTKWLLQVARVDVLLLDDLGMAPLDPMVRNDLLEIIYDCSAGKATADRALAPSKVHTLCYWRKHSNLRSGEPGVTIVNSRHGSEGSVTFTASCTPSSL